MAVTKAVAQRKAELGLAATTDLPPEALVESDEAKREAILKKAASGGWMQTWSGRRIYLDVEKFNVDDVLFEDVVHHLAHVNRYCGATLYAYSVMQHCTALARAFRRRWLRLQIGLDSGEFPGKEEETRKEITRLQMCEKQALLHDWPESFTNDIVAPFKQCLPQLKLLDKTMIAGVFKRNGLPEQEDLEVVDMDRRLCRNEMDVFGSPHVHKWWLELEPVPGVDPQDLAERTVAEVRAEFVEYCIMLGVR